MAGTNNDLNDASTGLQSLNSSGVMAGRTITGTSNQIGVTNGDGTAGAPTLALTSTIDVSGISLDSGSNILSAYADGTWSPTITGSTGNPTLTYASQVGTYTKIGTKVIINALILLSATSGGTGTIRLGALPFTTSATVNSNAAYPLIINNTTLSAGDYYVFLNTVNGTFGNVITCATGGTGTSLAYSTVSSTSGFKFSATYNI